MKCVLNIDKSKCLNCGICAEICPSCIIEMQEDGPVCVWERGCMACGHCVAICPTGALDNNQCPREEQIPVTVPTLDSTTAYEFLRSRRSVRCFRDELVPKEKISEILSVAQYAPTAANSQGLYYIVISDSAVIHKIADITAAWMEEEIIKGSSSSRYFNNVLHTYRERKIDIIARNAHQMVFALARRLNVTGISNWEQASAYAELYAPTVGVGTTIAGFIQTCGQEGYQPLRELLAVPTKQKIVGAMMLGYPKYKYRNLVTRQHLKVEFR